MARSGETIGKKEKEKKKLAKRREKAERAEERKAVSNKGKNVEELAYLDENGNLSATPPDPKKMREISLEDVIVSGVGRMEPLPEPDTERSGIISYFNNEKAYGFIKDKKNGESIFVHASALSSPVRENDRVTFKTERTPKGMSAIEVKKEV